MEKPLSLYMLNKQTYIYVLSICYCRVTFCALTAVHLFLFFVSLVKLSLWPVFVPK